MTDVIYRVGSGAAVVLEDQTSPVFIANSDEATITAWVSRPGKSAPAGAPSLDPTAPFPFSAGQWSLSANGDVTVIALPASGGSAITDLEYRIDGGAAVSFGQTTVGTFATTAEEGDDVQIRAVNAIGAADWSDTKEVPAATAGFFEDDFDGRFEDTPLGDDPAWTLLRLINGTADTVVITIASSDLRRGSGNSDGGWYRLDASTALPANQYAQVTVAQATASGHAASAALCRVTDADNWYEARAVRNEGGSAVNEIRLIRRAGGVDTVLGTAAWTYSVPVDLRIEAAGTSVRVLLGGVEVIAPVTDSTHAGGSAGLGLLRAGTNAAASRISAFECGAL